MKKITGMFVFLMLSESVFASAPPSWRPYMSTPNDQEVDGPCTIYAAIHCLEALYNYYYEFGNDKVEFDVDDAVSRFYGGDICDIFMQIKNEGVHPISGEESFPNFEHAYYGLKDEDRCQSLQEIRSRVDNYGPVCIKIKWNDDIKSEIGAYYDGDMVEADELAPYLDEYSNYHWVVVVDHGYTTVNDTLYYYLECLNSFQTGDNFFFKIDTANFSDWIHPPAQYQYDNTGYTYIHYQNFHNNKKSETPDQLDKRCPPKIYPYIIPTLDTYTESGTYDYTFSMNFRHVNEEIYILSTTETEAVANISHAVNTRKINISREYSDGYANNWVAFGELLLKNCIIRPFGTGDCDGVLRVSNGTLDLDNVLIHSLDTGISTFGIDTSIDANNITIANTDFGIYLAAGADIELSNSDI